MAYRNFLWIVLGIVTLTALGTENSEAQRAAPPSEIAKECSAQADAKFLKGQNRRKFRAQCIRAGKKAARSKQ
jgi:hypothetical protein